jgi:hypothetical protein
MCSRTERSVPARPGASAGYASECLVGLVKTGDRTLLLVRFVVEIENIPHLADEGGTVLWSDHPRFGAVRVQPCFSESVELSPERSTQRRFRSGQRSGQPEDTAASVTVSLADRYRPAG